MIPTMVKKKDLVVWVEKLVEGESYVMHNFKILKSQGQYRICEHDYKLLFIGATVVKAQPMPNILLKVYKFKSIKEIIDEDCCPSILIGMYILHFLLFGIYING